MTLTQFLWLLPIIWFIVCFTIVIKIGKNEKSWLYKLSDTLVTIITFGPLLIEWMYFVLLQLNIIK